MTSIARLFLILFFGALISLQAGQSAIVTAKWLSNERLSKDLVIVDVRDKLEFQQGHIAQAVNIPAYENLFGAGYMMPGLDELRELFSQAGIDHTSRVVVYDNGDFIWSARLYWILEVLGHNDVRMLNVGFNNWDKDLLPLSTKATTPEPREFVPRVVNARLETMLGTLVSIGEKTIVDGRAESHYLGEESKADRYGHIPTALNFACTQNYQSTQSGNIMRDFEELKELYANLAKDRSIILYCDGGAEAALNYVVLKELGYEVSVYDGSWIEWGNNPAVPVANPSLE